MEHRKRRRRRRRLNWRFFAMLGGLFLLIALIVAACIGPDDSSSSNNTQKTYEEGWMEIDGVRFYRKSDGSRAFGWLDADGTRYFLNEDGTAYSGWLEVNDTRYYLSEDGSIYNGWLEDNGVRYYIKEDGSMAKGTVNIDGVNYHFTSTGAPILMVNPWNPVPEDYEPDLVELALSISVEGSFVDRSCYDALVEMLAACNKASPSACVVSSYRTEEYQTNSYNKKVNYYLGLGYSEEDAKKEAATVIAAPGHSEHQLGLAVDIVDTRLWALEEEQATLPAQKWLMENSWKYGFILRYPKDTTDKTGIIYEPWHYRYVGKEVAKEIHDSEITLEEYLQQLSN